MRHASCVTSSTGEGWSFGALVGDRRCGGWANPLPLVILNAVKNQLEIPDDRVRRDTSRLTWDRAVWRLILHCVQNDKGGRVLDRWAFPSLYLESQCITCHA
jgi:hypothetical protein